MKRLHYQQKYIELKEGVYNEELTINLMRIEANYQERENMLKKLPRRSKCFN